MSNQLHEEDIQEYIQRITQDEQYILQKKQLDPILTQLDIFYQNYTGLNLDKDIQNYISRLLNDSNWYNDCDTLALSILLDVIQFSNVTVYVKKQLSYYIDLSIRYYYDF